LASWVDRLGGSHRRSLVCASWPDTGTFGCPFHQGCETQHQRMPIPIFVCLFREAHLFFWTRKWSNWYEHWSTLSSRHLLLACWTVGGCWAAMVGVGRLSASDLPLTVAVLERSLFGLGGCVDGEGVGGVRRPHSAVRSCCCLLGCGAFLAPVNFPGQGQTVTQDEFAPLLYTQKQQVQQYYRRI
jgi:hypothetical protein